MSDIKMRESVPADWSSLLRVHDRARPLELLGSFPAEAFVPLAEDPEHEQLAQCTILVAEQDGQVIGFAAFEDSSLDWLYVDPDHHRRGVGRLLLRACLERMQGAVGAIACANNSMALALYVSAGFRIVDRFEGENAGHRGPLLRLRREDPAGE